MNGIMGTVLAAFLPFFLVACASSPGAPGNECKKVQKPGEALKLDLDRYKPVQSRQNQNGNLAVAASISGGGHRAANFGAGVLLALEELWVGGTRYNALKEIDYFSTVSGGGFAAGSYLSALFDYSCKNDTTEDFLYQAYFPYFDESRAHENEEGFCRRCEPKSSPVCVARNIERGYRKPMMRALLNPRVIFTEIDRGDYLEEKIDNKLLGACWRGGRSLMLGDLFKLRESDAPVEFPYWVTNGTVFQNGAIFPFAPDVLSEYRVTSYVHERRRVRIDGVPSEDDLVAYLGVPLSVGVKASASFPLAATASTFGSACDPEKPYFHVLDGGLADNLGVLTAIDLLRHEDNASRRVLLVIDAYKESSHPFSESLAEPNVLDVVFRLPHIGLDSWRGRHTDTVERLAANESQGGGVIKAIFVNFEAIKGLPDSVELEACQYDGDYLYMDPLALYKEARKVGTDFNVTKKEARLLQCAGHAAVHAIHRRGEFMEAFRGYLKASE